MVIFLAMCGSIYQNTALQKVSQAMPKLSAADISNLVAGTSSRTYKALSESERALVAPQITDAMSNVWLFFLVAVNIEFRSYAAFGGKLQSFRGTLDAIMWTNQLVL